MRARSSGRLLAIASNFASHQLKPCSPSSESVCVHVYASILRRPYSAFAGGLQINYTQAVTRSLPSGSFASSSIIHESSLLSSKNAAAFMQKRSATGTTGTAQKLQETARAKAQSVLTAPRNAMQSTKEAVSSTTNAVINQMPKPAQRWVSTVRKPGGLQKAVTLQIEGLWQAHKRKLIGAGAILSMYFLWRALFGVTSIFVNLSETMAEFGFLALAAAIVAFTMLYFRRLYTIDPNAVYRKALVALNTNPGVLELMGAPLAGSEVRAYVMTGGGVRFKGWWPRYRARRVQMIFPLKGTDKRGLVSLEAKKRKGKYGFKLLAVDVPTAEGAEQRLFLDGDDKLYTRGGVMSELRDPFLRAISMQHTYEAEDEVDEAADDAAEAQEQRVRQASQVASTPEPHDGGLYFSQRVAYQARKLASKFQGQTAKEPAEIDKPASTWQSRS
ncbi:hypothetical protein WJX79_006830 [Trebouxia sp. C0005]